MKFLIYIFAVFFLFVFSAAAQTVAKTEPVLRIEVENGQTLDLKASNLARFPRREVKATGHDEKESVYSGYNLSDILLFAKAKIGKDELRGKELSSYLLVEAADGYKATFALAELAPEFTDRIILLADTRDGKPLDAKEGAWQIIVPGEKKHGRWVRKVIKLTVKNAGSVSQTSSLNKDADNAIYKVVFRKILEPWQSRTDTEFKALYLAVENKDPDKEIISEFGNSKIPVRPVSECLVNASDGTVSNGIYLLDGSPETKGILFRVSIPRWERNDLVTISAGSQTGNIGGNSCDYILQKENTEWKITSSKNCVVN